jgi:hypothetical protein
MVPSALPTPLPTYTPTASPTPAPFWVENQDIIIGVGVPAVASFIPIFFSKQICFYALEHWSIRNRKRGLLKIMMYNGCSRIFLADFIQAKENVEKQHLLDEKAIEEEKYNRARATSTVIGRLRHMKEESQLQYGDGDDRMIEMTENPMTSSSNRIEEGTVDDGERRKSSSEVMGRERQSFQKSRENQVGERQSFQRNRENQVGERQSFQRNRERQVGEKQSFQQNRQTFSLRLSDAMIDSDDETEEISIQESELEEGRMPQVTHPLGSRRQKKLNIIRSGNNKDDKSEDDVVVKAVYSLTYTNPDIQVLFNEGRYLTSSILSLPPSGTYSSDVVRTFTYDDKMNRAGDTQSAIEEMPLIYVNVYTNWIEDLPLIHYLFNRSIRSISSSYSLLSLLANSLIMLENKLVLVIGHWVVGCSHYYYHVRKISYQSKTLFSALLYPTWKTLLFGGRLLGVHYISQWKTGVSSEPSSSTSLKYCSSLSLLYSLQSFGNCYSLSYYSPNSVSRCLASDLPLKALTSSSECFLFSHHQDIPSSHLYLPSFLSVGYIGWKGSSLVSSSFSTFSSFSLLAAIRQAVVIDYITRIVVSSLDLPFWFDAVQDLSDNLLNSIQTILIIEESWEISCEASLTPVNESCFNYHGFHC